MHGSDDGDEPRTPASGEKVDRCRHHPGDDASPARVDRGDIAGPLVRREHRDAVGDANADGDAQRRRPTDHRVGLVTLRAARLTRLEDAVRRAPA